MRKQVLAFLSLACFTLLFVGCAKEKSFETGFGPSDGSLQSETSGDCLPKNVVGIYEATVALTADNYIEVDVEVTTPGSYTIVTDTVNGFSFKAQGYFTEVGMNTVKLVSSGTPVAKAISNFTVRYKDTECTVAVSVLPEGASGPAAFELAGTPNACAGAVVDGVYGQGIALNNSNTVTLSVNVTTIGVYNITTTTTNGITFKGTGALIDLGPTTITLNGSGTPVAVGPFDIPIAGPNSCTFGVNVVGPAEYTFDCSSIVVNGAYAANTQLGSANTIIITVNATTVGPYSITTNSADGMSFTGSGQISSVGGNDITLTGTGKPATAGSKTITITGVNGQTCTGDIVVTGPPVINWKFKAGTTEYSGETFTAEYHRETSGSFAVATLGYEGRKTGQSMTINLTDINGTIANNEDYKTQVTGVSNGATFAFIEDNLNLRIEADMVTSGTNMTIRITNHNATAKTFTGTFSGTAKIEGGALVQITGGEFKGNY